MLRVEHLYFEYPDKLVLNDVNFKLAPGEVMHVSGTNGSGKTTLLKLIAGILPLQTGIIHLQSIDISKEKAAYQHQLTYIGHKIGISSQLTVDENCYLSLGCERNRREIDTIINQFGLQEIKHVRCSLLSAGQRRRVALIRLLLSDSALWLLDEPLVALDAMAMEGLFIHIMNHLKKGRMVLLTSHQPLPATLQAREYPL